MWALAISIGGGKTVNLLYILIVLIVLIVLVRLLVGVI